MKILIAASNMVHINNFHRPYIDRFVESGYDVKIMASGDGADFNVGFKKHTFSLKNLILSLKIRKIIKREKFDVVYLNTTLAAFFIRLAMLGMKKRPYVVNTVHGYLFDKNTNFLKRKIYLLCEKAVKNVTDDIVVMNEEDLQIAMSNRLCLGGVYKINGMGVDFSKEKTEKIEKSNGKINLVFVGEISKRKNQIFLVRAMKKLPDYFTLTLVGDGAERKKAEKYIRKNSLSDRVKITGFTNDVYTYLSVADIYVSASHIEGLPFNIVEAMRSHLPIVASNIKGQRDLLPADCLYEYGNEDEYIKLVMNKSLAKTSYDVNRYSLGAVLDENMKIYERPLENEKSRIKVSHI